MIDISMFIPLIALFIIISLIFISMENSSQPTSKTILIKNLYLYMVSFVALMMIVVSATDLLQIVLKAYVFTKADSNMYGYPMPACPVVTATDTSTPTKPVEGCLSKAEMEKQDATNRASQQQRDTVRDISFLVVACPLFYFHWRLARKKE